ncbi:FAD-dependent oxidoreductase [Marinobacteraceae bacterium S3BR75-40.1]
MSGCHLRRFAIIGSGLAGLVCVQKLKEQGSEVRLFEKARGPGGRLSSRRLGDGTSVDIGAQAFECSSPGFTRFLEPFLAAGDLAETHLAPVFAKPSMRAALLQTPRYVGSPRMSAFARALAEGLDTVYECRIDSMSRVDETWWLEDTQGGGYGPFDAVIVTAPPAQAQALLHNHSFLSQLATDAVLQPQWVLAMGFDHPQKAPAALADDAAGVVAGLWHDSAKPGRVHKLDWWVVQATTGWSARQVETPPDEVATLLMSAALDTLQWRDPPITYRVHRWLYARPQKPSHRLCGWDEEQHLGICGDWLATGDVQGAFQSASELIARLRQ